MEEWFASLSSSSLIKFSETNYFLESKIRWSNLGFYTASSLNESLFLIKEKVTDWFDMILLFQDGTQILKNEKGVCYFEGFGWGHGGT